MIFDKIRCGYATVHGNYYTVFKQKSNYLFFFIIIDVLDKSLEDRMESFFISETLKYLYLVISGDFYEIKIISLFNHIVSLKIFDTENYLNRQGEAKTIFTTEGHFFPILKKFSSNKKSNIETQKSINKNKSAQCSLNFSSNSYHKMRSNLPMNIKYFERLFDMIGLHDDIENLLDRKSH